MKILVTGFLGRVGSTSARMVTDHENFELVALVDGNVSTVSDDLYPSVAKFATIEEAIEAVDIDVAVDFTQPQTAYYNTKYYIEHRIHPVIGTTGFSEDELQALIDLSAEKKLGGIIAPNFAIGSVLMQVFAGQAAKYFPDVEIIELHHDQKLDAPSGTAEKTAKLIYENRGDHETGHPEEKETMPGARGANYHGIHIHSVRLPGLNSHQVVQFGGPGESLQIRQDSFDRESYMKGVAMGIEHSFKSEALIYGLEHLL